jgi:hypothetical protein
MGSRPGAPIPSPSPSRSCTPEPAAGGRSTPASAPRRPRLHRSDRYSGTCPPLGPPSGAPFRGARAARVLSTPQCRHAAGAVPSGRWGRAPARAPRGDPPGSGSASHRSPLCRMARPAARP